MFRRNGKPVSCEPCRVSKIRCDHQRPICGRCQTRQKESQCFYHPAPLTRAHRNPGPRPSRRTRATVSSSPAGHTPVTTRDDEIPQTPGYLGSTSFVSAFPRPELLFPSDVASVPSLSLPSEFCSAQVSYAHSQLLELISSFTEYQNLVVNYYQRGQFSIVPRNLVLNPLFKTGSYLEKWKHNRSGARQETLIEDLSRMSSTRLPIPSVDATVEDLCASFSGSSLRWEFVGIIFAFAGLAASYPEAGEPYQSGEFATEMFAASKTCIEICEQCSQLNDLSIWLRYLTVALASNLFGDTSNLVYRCLSDLVCQIFAMGLHRQSSLQERVPFFLSETRKRIFAATFTRDKNLATYLGRPPLIDSHFCDLLLPLDLDDDELTEPGNIPGPQGNSLDSDGWKTNEFSLVRSLRSVTGLRLRCGMAILREKVLRLSLGNRGTDQEAHLPGIVEDYQKAWEAVPQQYRYDNDAWNRLDPHSWVVCLIVYLDHCYTGYQLHRMRLRQNEDSRGPFLEAATKLLAAMNDFARRQAQTIALQRRYMWVFLFYGLPGAGSLVSELHRCSTADIPFPVPESRPRIIRDLSVLISWLEGSVFPNRPEYRTCLVISALISKLLDEVLLGPQMTLTVDEQTGSDFSIAAGRRARRTANPAASPFSGVTDSQSSQLVASSFPTMTTGPDPLHGETVDTGFPPDLADIVSSEDCVNWLDGFSWDSHPWGEGWPLFPDKS
ncbi:hypothetical protein BO94DRAFT_473718 [Aspergillus sclerotioniger CBS 115572]|uniref:Zn(2)-C6 fungal-type domain-containing protein n=1 Tax=Aspergillus sclerotioniger CBS 115572 TaxID=1450535 RepID=A0A317VRT4_9EURO|nr:hypothetical protein BO94DRAFT_473718 [Aspergillus sclerotioniger CBS 115572]PWY76001.1 hypothetical protein BO94DRAFT_473718 [Aspergillus sclerotioniger CBS 115572]